MSAEDDTRHHRTVRSYVLREGRLTRGQERAFATAWPRFGVDYAPGPLDLAVLFGSDNPVCLEIGFGNGESLVTMARENPGTNYLGIEVHGPGVGHLLMRIEEEGLQNVRACRHDAIEVIDHMLPDASLDRVQLFFPDPWHKKRHHKRRIVQASFVERLVRVLKPGGLFHAATDWEHYAGQMMDVLGAEPRLENTAGPGRYTARPAWRPLTKFERRGERLGHGVWDLVFRRLD